MTKTYMVVRNGKKKEDGAPYSLAQRLCSARDGSSQWLDVKSSFWTDDIRPVGTEIQVEELEM